MCLSFERDDMGTKTNDTDDDKGDGIERRDRIRAQQRTDESGDRIEGCWGSRWW